jgi:hypothetical protein
MPPLQRGVPKAGGLKNSINLNANQYKMGKRVWLSILLSGEGFGG